MYCHSWMKTFKMYYIFFPDSSRGQNRLNRYLYVRVSITFCHNLSWEFAFMKGTLRDWTSTSLQFNQSLSVTTLLWTAYCIIIIDSLPGRYVALHCFGVWCYLSTSDSPWYSAQPYPRTISTSESSSFSLLWTLIRTYLNTPDESMSACGMLLIRAAAFVWVHIPKLLSHHTSRQANRQKARIILTDSVSANTHRFTVL